MKIAIRMTKREELKALPILLRHSPGMVLPRRIYVISVETVRCLRNAGVKFTALCGESEPPAPGPTMFGERI